MLICYNQNEGAITGMKQYTKEEVTALSNEELLHYINYLLKNGYSLSQLERDKVATRKTISNKLKKIGYIYNKTSNSYVKCSDVASEPSKEPQNVDEIQELRNIIGKAFERIEALEMRLNDSEKIEENIPSNFKPTIFNSEVQPRNYPLHKEVTDLLTQVSKENPHLKVKDIVNHCLFIGLSQAIHSDNVEKA